MFSEKLERHRTKRRPHSNGDVYKFCQRTISGFFLYSKVYLYTALVKVGKIKNVDQFKWYSA